MLAVSFAAAAIAEIILVAVISQQKRNNRCG
jgi:hypothetical protein